MYINATVTSFFNDVLLHKSVTKYKMHRNDVKSLLHPTFDPNYTDQIIVLDNITLQCTITMIVFKFDILPSQVQQGQRMESKLGKQW